jgi:hypothetical protein
MAVTEPFLSVLIATMGHRRSQFFDLLERLLPQAEASGAVEVIGLYANGEHRLPVVRQRLLEAARGTFTCFIDDDDMVSENYVEVIIDTLCRPGNWHCDSLGFRVHLTYRDQMSVCSRAPAEAVPFPAEPLWYHDWGIMTPTRTAAAQRCRFDTYTGGRVGEDGWFKLQLLPLLRDEAYVDEVLYHYQWNPEDSVQTHLKPVVRAPLPEIHSPVFSWHPWSIR